MVAKPILSEVLMSEKKQKTSAGEREETHNFSRDAAALSSWPRSALSSRSVSSGPWPPSASCCSTPSAPTPRLQADNTGSGGSTARRRRPSRECVRTVKQTHRTDSCPAGVFGLEPAPRSSSLVFLKRQKAGQQSFFFRESGLKGATLQKFPVFTKVILCCEFRLLKLLQLEKRNTLQGRKGWHSPWLYSSLCHLVVTCVNYICLSAFWRKKRQTKIHSKWRAICLKYNFSFSNFQKVCTKKM